MKVLLSAYSCDPSKGSEPGVGWNWAYGLASQGYKVTVITLPLHKVAIEKTLGKIDKKIANNLDFEYYDLLFWQRKKNIATQLHYQLWQFGLYRFAKLLDKTRDFDIIHHITFGVFRQPSLLAFVGKPFVFGPVGGGETAPYELITSFPVVPKIKEITRNSINILSKFNPLLWVMYSYTDLIICKTQETLNFIPKKYKKKAQVLLEIGIKDRKDFLFEEKDNKVFNILFVGRLIHWKGPHLAIRAFEKFHNSYPLSSLTIVGSGKDEKNFKNLAVHLGINDSIKWLGNLDHKEVIELYSKNDIFLFPSLHDSSGNVLLEAISNGLPVICLDLGGPGEIITESCGKKINVIDKNEDDIVEELANNLSHFYNNRKLLNDKKRSAEKYSRNFYWNNVIGKVSNQYHKLSNRK